ncbi:MAG TPA: HIRAN domain-containing protein [Thiobacillus sp.]
MSERHNLRLDMQAFVCWATRSARVRVSVLLMLWGMPLQAQIASHILLQDSPLAGFQYHAGKQLWPQMQVGDVLTLAREPDNVHDAKAVRVEWQGHKIGYVPRRENSDVARFMDGGHLLVARINRLAEVRDPWSRVRFEILIPVQPTGQVTP